MLFADSRKDRLCIKRLVGTELDIEELYVSKKDSSRVRKDNALTIE